MSVTINPLPPVHPVHTEHRHDCTPISCFSSFTQLFRRVFRKNKNQSQYKVHAVDSVRLIYLQRILSDTLLENNQRNVKTVGLTKENISTISMCADFECSILRHNQLLRPNIENLETALRNYEKKYRRIIEKTASPSDKFINPETPKKFHHILRYQLRSLNAVNSEDGTVCKIETSFEKLMIGKMLLESTKTEVEKRNTEDDEGEKNVCFDVETKASERDSESEFFADATEDFANNKRKFSVNVYDLV